MALVSWTPQSMEDLESIVAYISRDSEKYASAQLNRFFDAVSVLETHPEFGKPVPEFKRPEIRELLIGSYRIIYRIVDPNTIHILTIHHSRRLLSHHFFE